MYGDDDSFAIKQEPDLGCITENHERDRKQINNTSQCAGRMFHQARPLFNQSPYQFQKSNCDKCSRPRAGVNVMTDWTRGGLPHTEKGMGDVAEA